MNVFLLWLDLGQSMKTALRDVAVWGPPLGVAAVVAATARHCPDIVCARVRTVVALVDLDTHLTSLTCTDTCPDTSASSVRTSSGPGPKGC